MYEPPVRIAKGLTTRGSQPLIGVPTSEGSDQVVHYFTSETDADRATVSDEANIQRALGAIGAWSDLDFDEMLDTLDQIRHQSIPTPPLTSEL